MFIKCTYARIGLALAATPAMAMFRTDTKAAASPSPSPSPATGQSDQAALIQAYRDDLKDMTLLTPVFLGLAEGELLARILDTRVEVYMRTAPRESSAPGLIPLAQGATFYQDCESETEETECVLFSTITATSRS